MERRLEVSFATGFLLICSVKEAKLLLEAESH